MKPNDILRLLLLASIWGSSYLFIKMIAPEIGVALTMKARVIIAAAFLVVMTMVNGQFPDFKKYWWQYIFLGAFNLVLPNILVVFSVMRLNASMGSILNSATPLFTLLIARIWLKEKLTPAKIIGLLSGMIGIVILVGWNPIPMNGYTLTAIFASILAAVCYGIANVFSKIKFSGSTPMQTASGQMMGAAVLVIPFLFSEPDPKLFSAKILIPLLILGIASTALAFILYFKLVSSIGSVNTSLVTILVPVFGITWSAIFLSEPVTIGLLIGMIFIIIGLTLVLRPASYSLANSAALERSFIQVFLFRLVHQTSLLLKKLKYLLLRPVRDSNKEII